MKNVAVLIPSYKPQDYLEKCLMSLENQNLEKSKFCVYILLNGEQFPYEDYVLNLLSNMTFKYKYIYTSQAGVSNARNMLIENSNEDFIVFIDDDDLVSENYLKNLLQVSTDSFIGISNIYNFDKDINILNESYIGKSFNILKNKEISKYKIRKYFSSPVAKMIHRKIIDNFRFDINVSKGEDSLFMALISKNVIGIQKTSQKTCYYVYERIGSSTRKKINIVREIKTIFYLTKQYLKLLFKQDYEKIFILTRIVATLLKLLTIKKEY